LSEFSRSPDLLESIYETFPILHCLVNSDGLILDCNKIYAKRIGYSKSELVGASIFGQVDANNLVPMHEYLEICKKIGPVENREIWLKTRDATVFPALLNAAPLLDNQGKFVGCSVALVDETDIYRSKRDIEKANEELKLKEQLKNEFIAVASHELRTPIQPLLGYALLAKRGKVTQEAAWDGVLREARRLQQLANDILDVSRIESGGIAYNMERVRIHDLIASVATSEKANLAKDVTLDFMIDELGKELEIELDRSRITQVLTNLVGNAIKFTQKGSIKIECKTFLDKGKFEIKISDTGGGIPENILPKLFEKFVTKNVGDNNKNGTGLGLFISKAIVTAHNGEIYARNDPGIGAIFTIVLPLEQKKEMFS